MKRLLVVPLALILAACATPPSDGATTGDNGLTERTVTLKDGRTIPCVYWISGPPNGDNTVSGIDCDWHPDR